MCGVSIPVAYFTHPTKLNSNGDFEYPELDSGAISKAHLLANKLNTELMPQENLVSAGAPVGDR